MEELNPDQIIASLKQVSLQAEPGEGERALTEWVADNLPMVLPPGVKEPDYVGALEQLAIYVQQNGEAFENAEELGKLRARVKELEGTAAVELLARVLNGVPILKSHDLQKQLNAFKKMEVAKEGVWIRAVGVLRGAPKDIKREARSLFNAQVLRQVLAEDHWISPYFGSSVSELREKLLEETGGDTFGEKEQEALRALEQDAEALALGPFTFEERMVAEIIAARLNLSGEKVSRELDELDALVDKLQKETDERVSFRRLWGLNGEAQVVQDELDTFLASLPKEVPTLLKEGKLKAARADWTKAFNTVFQESVDRCRSLLEKLEEEWKEQWESCQTIAATQSGQPIWGGLCLSSSSKVAGYLVQHPNATDLELKEYLKTEVIEQLKALGVPDVLWPKDERAFFALQERLVQVRYKVAPQRDEEVVFRRFGLVAGKSVELGDTSSLAREFRRRARPAEKNAKDIADEVWNIHEERGVEGRAIYILRFNVALGVGHAIEIDLNSENDVYSFWDPNRGRYTFSSAEDFRRALAGLLFVIYPATRANLVPVF